MNEYSVKLNGLRSQSDVLWASYLSLRSCSLEIPQVVRALQTMTSFSTDILRLRRAAQKMETQYSVLNRISGTLNEIADCYQEYENRNLQEIDGGLSAGRLTGQLGQGGNGLNYVYVTIDNTGSPNTSPTDSGNSSIISYTSYTSGVTLICTDKVETQQMLPLEVTSMFVVTAD